jgi:hypothetical protein
VWAAAVADADADVKGLPYRAVVQYRVNLQTAQTLGITFPNEIILQVTEAIQ